MKDAFFHRLVEFREIAARFFERTFKIFCQNKGIELSRGGFKLRNNANIPRVASFVDADFFE